MLFIIKFMCDVTRGPTGKLIRAGMPRSRILSRFWHLGGMGFGDGRHAGGRSPGPVARPPRGAGRGPAGAGAHRHAVGSAARGRGARGAGTHSTHGAATESRGQRRQFDIRFPRRVSRVVKLAVHGVVRRGDVSRDGARVHRARVSARARRVPY